MSNAPQPSEPLPLPNRTAGAQLTDSEIYAMEQSPCSDEEIARGFAFKYGLEQEAD